MPEVGTAAVWPGWSARQLAVDLLVVPSSDRSAQIGAKLHKRCHHW